MAKTKRKGRSMTINGQKVFDARKSVTLEISTPDIRGSSKKDPAHCAAAQACMNHLSAEAARIHIGRCYLKMKGKWFRFCTPHSLRTEIIAFDRGGRFNPGKHTLMPVPLAEIAARGGQTGSKTGQNKTGGKRRRYYVVTGIRAHPHQVAE